MNCTALINHRPCNGKMKPGKYLVQTLSYGSMEKLNRFKRALRSPRGITVNEGGPGILKTCMKCKKCGHSEVK